MRDERKPVMSKDTRKILNLLEFILEMRPEQGSVYNQFVCAVAQQDDDLMYVTDDVWAGWFQDYAEKISKEGKDV